jgi:hypothetical protein
MAARDRILSTVQGHSMKGRKSSASRGIPRVSGNLQKSHSNLLLDFTPSQNNPTIFNIKTKSNFIRFSKVHAGSMFKMPINSNYIFTVA